MSSVNKSTIEDLQEDLTLKKCFIIQGKRALERELRWRIPHEEWIASTQFLKML